MNRKLLYSALNTVLKNYSSRFVIENSYKPYCKYATITPDLFNKCLNFSTQANDDIATYKEVKECCSGSSKNGIIIDVREPEELRETGVLPRSINIPLGNVENVLKNMSSEDFVQTYGIRKPSKEQPVIFSCKSGKRSATAQSISRQMGYRNVKNYLGGWLDWAENNQSNLSFYSSTCSTDVNTNQHTTVTYDEVKRLKDDPKYLLIDVREPHELKEIGIIPGAINIPLNDIEKALSQMPVNDFKSKYGRDKPTKDFNIIFSCRSGRRSGIAQEKALALGYKNVSNYLGGWLDWEKRDGEV